ncbi:1-acyl-sn-glycerol-3-phosphate acyltransferase [Candidatus Saccharibacteria bacterium]|nr:1-acyl-sn-glycerol-3-phosphate acyltransferase [Candidatus Saccharibacteria bacterium]
MAFDSTGEIKWQIPDGYYEQVAQSDVDSRVHWAGRMLVAPVTGIMFGSPIIVMSKGFIDARPEFPKGNIVIASTHRSDWETVIQPAGFERVDLHHARPLAKLDPLFQGPVRRWTMHHLGSFAVDKRPGQANMEEVLKATSGILSRGGIVNYYMEGTRVTDTPLTVKKGAIKVGGIVAAAVNNSLIVPTALAGLSKVKEGEGKNRRTVEMDKRSWFGMKRPLVMAFEDPFRLERPSFDPEILSLHPRKLSKVQRSANYEYLRFSAARVAAAMDAALRRAYEERGSSLEKRAV